MSFVRAALCLALLVAPAALHAQQTDVSDVPPRLRASVAAYRAGDLIAAETTLRGLASSDPDAEAWLGVVLLDRGRTQEALQLLQHASDAGSAEGSHRLGLLFIQGAPGVPRNDARARELFERAAAAGHIKAQINVGTLCFRGQGGPRDLVRARMWLEKAATTGNPYALYALGRAMEDGFGPAAADPARAADLYRRAAQLGHPLAALRYGLALSEGRGVRRDTVKSQAWLAYAEKSGVPEAAFALGELAMRSPSSQDKAADEAAVRAALAWFDAAARAGVASAQLKLANAYLAGVGVPRDPQQAQSWYNRAANQGLADAQIAFGVFLTNPASGINNPIEGYKWLLLAERSGQPEAKEVLEKSAEKLGDRDRRQAEALAGRFVPQPERALDDTPPRLGPPPRL